MERKFYRFYCKGCGKAIVGEYQIDPAYRILCDPADDSAPCGEVATPLARDFIYKNPSARQEFQKAIEGINKKLDQLLEHQEPKTPEPVDGIIPGALYKCGKGPGAFYALGTLSGRLRNGSGLLYMPSELNKLNLIRERP